MKEGAYKRFIEKSVQQFELNYNSHWARLSEATILFVILNVSMFFLTELVTKYNYYYTFFSLLCLGIVELGILLPIGFHHRIWYYIIFLVMEFSGIYFLVVSAWFWVSTNRV